MGTPINQGSLKESLYYNRYFGIFVWKKNRRGKAIKGSIAGRTTATGYIEIKMDGKPYLAHRLAFLYCYGNFPKNHTDHINGVRTDNRLANLRGVTAQENQKNRKTSSNNKSGHNGVSWCKSSKKWRAHIKVKKRQIMLGSFENINDAIRTRKEAEKMYGFHKNHGRLK